MRRPPRSSHVESGEAVRAGRRRLARRRRTQRRVALVALSIVVLAAALFVVVVRHDGSGPAGRPPRAHTARSQASTGSARGGSRVARPLVQRDRQVSSVPILMYHVINAPPPNAAFPGLYVTPRDFALQMKALAAAGYRGVTLDEVASSWKHRTSLPPGRPIVISFDNGYRSQYTNALSVLRRLRWPAVENLQLSGLPPSQGGLTTRQVRRLVRDGWELDTQGFSHADLPTLDARQLRHEVLGARIVLRNRFHVPVNWFCYPSGHYNSTVIAAVESAGYSGATTVIPGWASTTTDPYRLPRLRVLAGTTPSMLLTFIAATRDSSPPPAAYP